MAVEKTTTAVPGEHSSSTEAAYGAGRQQQISVELWGLADVEKEQLFALMEQVRFKLEIKSGGETSNLDLRKCKWEQVMKEVSETGRKWKRSSKKTSKAMECLNKLGRYSGAFEKWLELLPNGDYGASICGVFKLVVAAAGQYARVEDAVFEALSDIPEIMENARTYVQIYANIRDSSLERRTFDLFRAILRTLTQIMRFFLASALRKFSEPLFKQTSYKKELFAGIEAIKKHTARVKEEGEQCLAKSVVGQGPMISTTHENSKQGLHYLESIHTMLLHKFSMKEPDVWKAFGEATPCRRRKAVDCAASNQGRPTDADQAHRLLELLGDDPSLPERDIVTALHLAMRLGEKPKARAAAMIRNDRFTAFLAEPTSSSLLVNGRADIGAVDGDSPLSLVAAELAASCSEDAKSVFAVKYFCGKHRPGLEPSVACSPVGLMASLVGQLVRQMLRTGIPVNLLFLTNVDWQHVEKLKLNILCIIFRELALQLPAGSVLLCLLDEVSLYEIARLNQDADSVVRRVTRLASKHGDVIFKLLVTCHGRALRISKYFIGQTVDLAEDVEEDDSTMWQISRLSISSMATRNDRISTV